MYMYMNACVHHVHVYISVRLLDWSVLDIAQSRQIASLHYQIQNCDGILAVSCVDTHTHTHTHTHTEVWHGTVIYNVCAITPTENGRNSEQISGNLDFIQK